MPQTIKVQSGKSGKTYDMPWSNPNDPSDDDIDTFISSQEPTEPKKSLWDKANTPLTQAVPVVKDLHPFDALSKKIDPQEGAGSTIRNYAGLYTKSLGGVLESLTSPVNLTLTALTAGAGAAESGLPTFAKVLRGTDVAANTAMAGNAAYEGIKHKDPAQILPFALGAMGAKGAYGRYAKTDAIAPANSISPVPEVNTKVPPPSPEFTPVGEEPAYTPPNRPQVSSVDAVMQNQNQNGVRTLNQVGTKKSILPNDLRGSKPRFNMGNKIYIPQFENDLDKAAYIIAQNVKSKRDADFLKFFMDSTGMSEASARQYGQQVRGRIKTNAIGAPEGDLPIPDMFTGFKRKAPLTNTEVTNAAIVKDALDKKVSSANPSISPVSVVKPKTRVNPDGSFDLLNPSKETLDKAGATGYHPSTGEINPDGSITMVKVVGGDNITPTPPVTGPSPLNIRGQRNTSPFPEGTNGGNVPPNGIPPSGGGNVPPSGPIEPVLSPEPPNSGKPKFGLVSRVGNNLKSLTTGIDLSAPLRQGRAMMFNKEWYSSWKPMIQSMLSDEGHQRVMESIKNDPNFELAQKSKLAFTDLGEDLQNREEHLGSDFAQNLPVVGKLYKGSGRAYSGFLNKLRMDSFNSMVGDIQKAGGEINEEVSKKVADVINNATGRANLGKYEGAAPLLNATFFAPRFVVSRFKVLTDPVIYRNADPVVRKQALKSLLAVASTQATLAGLTYATSGNKHTSVDPRGSDFLKFKRGNARLDTNGGIQQGVVALAKILSGSETSSTSGKNNKLDTGKFGARKSGDVIWDYLSSKEAPLASLLGELWTGHDMVGNATSKPEAIVRHTTPMVLQDLYDVIKDDPSNLWMIPPGVTGASVQVYQPKSYKRKVR